MYTTTSLVREISGLDNSTYISDIVVKGKIAIATSMIDGAIAYRYQLPLAYHRQSTLTFAGTGSGNGTMAIVINGTTYNISISNGLTATQAADLFRNACISATDFVADEIGMGTECLIISTHDSNSLTTANAEVNITSAPTTNGISATIGTRSDRYTPFVSQLCADIASALLLMDNYGIEAQDTPKDGNARMARCDVILARLQGKSIEGSQGLTARLYDEITKEELALASGDSPRFFPYESGVDSNGDSTLAKVTINTML